MVAQARSKSFFYPNCCDLSSRKFGRAFVPFIFAEYELSNWLLR